MFFFSLITLNNGQDLTITVTDFVLVSYLSLIGKRGCEGIEFDPEVSGSNS